MKHELPEPEWYFAQDENHLSLIVRVRILIWPQGLCLGGYDDQDRAITGKVFLWSNNWNTERITQIFENEPMVAGPQPITDVWISTDQQLQIPPHLFEKEKATSWLRQFHFIETDYSIFENRTTTDKTLPRVIFAAPGHLVYKLDRFFPEARIDILSSALIHSVLQQKEDQLLLSFLNQTVSITWVSKGHLKYFQLFAYDTCEDIIYRLVQITETHGIELSQLQVSYQGLVPTGLTRELPAYLKYSHIADQESLLFDLLNQLSICAS